MHALLKMLRQVSGWDEPMGAQKGRGVASRIYSVSPIANTVEVTVSDDGQYTVDRIVCVVDCGFAVNPLGIESQIHGGSCSASMRPQWAPSTSRRESAAK